MYQQCVSVRIYGNVVCGVDPRGGVPANGDGMEAYGWRREVEVDATDATGESSSASASALRGWVVQEVIPMKPRPSPPLRRVLRSIFVLDADVEQLLLYHDDHEDEILDDLDGEEAGRWDDEGANDRPWH